MIKNGFYTVKQHKIISQIHNSHLKNEQNWKMGSKKNVMSDKFL